MSLAADRTQALADRLRANTLGALELYTLYLGERLGLYRALADGEAVTSSELAERTGTVERYVREWLERRAPRPPLGGRGRDLPRQPRPALSTAPPGDPPRLRRPDARWSARVHAT